MNDFIGCTPTDSACSMYRSTFVPPSLLERNGKRTVRFGALLRKLLRRRGIDVGRFGDSSSVCGISGKDSERLAVERLFWKLVTGVGDVGVCLIWSALLCK